MSIVPLERATFVGLSSDKEQLLDDLHEFGCLEIIPLSDSSHLPPVRGPSSQAREAFKFLLSAPKQRYQVADHGLFNAADVERRALELKCQVQTLEAERDDLLLRLSAADPFGDFEFAPLEQMGGQRLWFYAIPHKQTGFLNTGECVQAWEQVAHDQRFSYIVVVAEHEPQNMPVDRLRIGSRSPMDLRRRLDEAESEIEDAQAKRTYLTRWCMLFARSLTELEDAAARARAGQETCDLEPVFALEAWVPAERIEELAAYAHKHQLAFSSRPPSTEETPPTFVRNRQELEAGEDLVNFYMTPGYRTWDPAAVVLVSFAIFFAMIMADAGYALVLGVGLAFFWKRLGQPAQAPWLTRPGDIEQGDPVPERTVGQRFRPLLLLIVLTSLVYGVIVGSYFGISPPTGSLLGRLHLLDMNNSNLMMAVSILVGVAHVVLANVMNARRFSDWRDGVASWGWALTVGGGLLLAAGYTMPEVPRLETLSLGMIIVGLCLVMGWTAWREKPLRRMAGGLLSLTKVSAAFGDVLSYLRLFALGLASASLATAFNDMAAGIHSSMPRFGLLFALLVLLFGHSLNLLLAVSSGVIHGLRLNVIEFFNWGLTDEGRRFTPFRRGKGSLWT